MTTIADLEARMDSLDQTLNFLVADVIKPLSDAVVATQQLAQTNQERFDRLMMNQAEDRNVAEQAIAEQSQQIQNLLEDAREDRRQSRQASAEQSRRIQTLIEDAREDRRRNQEKFDSQMQRIDSQMQVMQAQLLQLATLNRRVDGLEQQAS